MGKNADPATIWNELEQIVGHDELCRFGRPSNLAVSVLKGWDVSRSHLEVDRPACGVWRAPHPVVVHGLDVDAIGLVPVLHAGMNAAEIQAGIWRQLRIFPADQEWRKAGVYGRATSDPFGPDGELVKDSLLDVETRNPIIRSLLLATPADAADYLAAKLRSAPHVGRLLLAKEFRLALEKDRSLWNDDWPEAVKQRNRRFGYREFLKPVAFLIVLACFARLAQNVCAHLLLAYQDQGKPWLIANVRHALVDCTTGLAPPSIRKFASYALLQTTALLPPDTVFEKIDRGLGERWSNAATDVVARVFAEQGREATKALTHPRSMDDAELVRDGLMAHPSLRPNNGPQQHRNRRAPYATFYGTTPKIHAMAGAFQIRSQVENWLDIGGSKGCTIPIRKSEDEGRPFSRQQAAAALFYLWLETSHPAALPRELGSITRQPSFDGASPTSPPGSVDELVVGQYFGDSLAKQAEAALKTLDRPGHQNFGAWYHPSLWLDDDDARLPILGSGQQREHSASGRIPDRPCLTSNDLSRIGPGVLERVGLGKGLRLARKARRRSGHVTAPADCSLATTYAQRSAMTVSTLATDQMWRLLLPTTA